MTLVRFTSIAGATVFYPPQGLKPRRVALEEKFHARLEAMFLDLWQRCPWGQAQWIGSLGCYVPSTPDHDTGRHDSGEAFDLASVRFPAASVERGSAEPYPAIPRESEIAATDPGPKTGRGCARYLALESIIRLHFQTALDWWFNAAHRDHWHLDLGNGEPIWQGRSNQVRFLQAALRYVWQAGELAIDGDLGPKTMTAYATSGHLVSRLPHEGWTAFLEETARRGFAV